MSQFKKTRLRTLPTQGFDDTENNPASTVHCNPGRLVDNQQGIIFKDDRQLGLELRTSDHIFHTLCDTNGWDAQHVANLKTIGSVCALAVYPNFTAANDAIDVAFWNTLADLQQVVIEALPLLVFANDGLCDGTFANFGHFEYTDLDLRLGLKETLTHKTVERRRLFCSFFNCDALSGRHQTPRLHRPVQDQTAQITWLSTLTKSSDTT
jgi:hypothetical protein